MVKRLGLSLFIAVTVTGFNIPLPAVGSTPQQPPGRVLINAPEMPAVDLTPPAPPAGAPKKHSKGNTHSGVVVKAGELNHVTGFTSDVVAKLRASGLQVLDNHQGLVRVEATINGEARVLTVVDGVLPSGREVIGFGTAPLSARASAATSLVRTLNVSADTRYFAICSYMYMDSYWDDLHVHLCAIDAAYTLAILGVLEATAGTVVGLFMGGPVGAAVGLAVGTAAALLTILYFWTHSDANGNVDFVIPNQTMLPPFGGDILWANIGRWDYMWDQCWIYEGGWYDPVCSW